MDNVSGRTAGPNSRLGSLAVEEGFLAQLPAAGSGYQPQQPITQALQELISSHGYAAAFEQALQRVGQQRIPGLEGLCGLDQLYGFIDALATWIPGLRIWEWQGEVYHERSDYLRLMEFYYLFNQPELRSLQSPIHPKKGMDLTPLSLWLRQFAISWGAFLDTPASAARLETYRFGPEYAWQDYEGGEDGISGYNTFNAWFGRCFKNIDLQRPVAQPADARVLVFPAESTYVGQWAISTRVGDPCPAEPSIVVKHVAWPIPELLKDSPYARDFDGGLFIHSFLNIFDYHRQHAPAAGRVLEARFIPGQVYLDVQLASLNPEGRAQADSSLARAVIPTRYLEANDSTGYQFLQCRGLFVLDTSIGKIAVLPMGMAQVSSVAFVKPGTEELMRPSQRQCQDCSYEQQVELINQRVQAEVVGRSVEKGEMMSSFLFGGSDIVMLFQRRACVNITARPGVHYPVRSQCAYANIDRLLTIP